MIGPLVLQQNDLQNRSCSVQDTGLLDERVQREENRLSLKESETGPNQMEMEWRKT